MKHLWIGNVTLLAIATSGLASLVLAQRGGGNGLGRVAGGVSGAAAGTTNSTIARPNPANSNGQGRPGAGAGQSVNAAERITQNAELSTRLQPLLPAGQSMAAAAAGFDNDGQFLGTLHVAHNLNIPFDQLKARMTGSNPESLGKAIHDLRPTLDNGAVKSNVKLAERQADNDLQKAASAGKPDKFAKHIAADTKLAARLQTLLPPGMTLETAATGFKNHGQFIAALEVSKNLDIPFADLKDRVTAGQSLGEAIHQLKPDMSEAAVDKSVTEAEAQSKTIQVEASAQAGAHVNTER